jgi:hypothetical protein
MQRGDCVIETVCGRDAFAPGQPRDIDAALESPVCRRTGIQGEEQGIAAPGGPSVRVVGKRRRCWREVQDGSGSPLSTDCSDLETTGTCWI